MFPQGAFEQARLMIAPIEDRVIRIIAGIAKAVMNDVRSDLPGLADIVFRLQYSRLVALAQRAPESLFEHVGIVGDEMVGSLQDACRWSCSSAPV